MKKTKLLLLLGVVSVLFLSMHVLINAATLFSDNFNDGNADGWATQNGTWSVVEDSGSYVYYQSSTSEGRASSGASTWINYSVQARVKVDNFNGSNRAYVCARYGDGNNYYAASLYNSSGGKLEIRKKVGGSSTTLVSKSYSLSAGTWYTVKLEVNGSTINMYVNGSLELTTTDSSLTSGKAGLIAYKVVAKFDDVTVDDLSGGSSTPTPTTSTATPTPTPASSGSTPTPTTTQSGGTIYQAENGVIYNGVVATNHTGYTGTGFVDYTNETGSYIEWTVNMSQSGNQTLTFRYANGTSTNRSVDIYVNGNLVVSNLAFNGTGAWTTWSTQTATVYLNSGSNTIRATANTSNGGPNTDYLQVTGQTVSATPTPTPKPAATTTPTPTPTPSQTGTRQMENLDRGVVAVKVSGGAFVSWRMFGTEPSSVSYNLYRGSTKVNSSPITGATNYLDASGTTSSTYSVRAIINGIEQAASPNASVWSNNYLQVPLQVPSGGTTPDGVSYTYSANDCSVGDLDGDGKYEIVVKWDPSNSQDNANSGYTGNVYLDAYTLTGTRLWRIDLGINIRAGAHYTQFIVYDLDGDGDAEVACKTADGTIDGAGNVIGSASADYRNSSGYILSGPEYLTIFSGATGRALETVSYQPARGTVSNWGDSYGNRVDRFLACVAYLDGKRPSLVMCRGYYTRSVLVAWDYRDGNLTQRWTFDTNNGYSSYAGQGSHSLSVADVDSDGKDEIIYGACAIDHDGKGLYSTGLGHGDALHVSDFDPNRQGLEVWQCHENSPYGASFRDARSGSVIFRKTASKDTGRACIGDISASYSGCEMWASASVPLTTSTGQELGSHSLPINFMIWWDGDLSRELLDGTTITKYNGGTLLSASGFASNNGTKATPSLTADILGDWREEAIWRTSDSKYLRIYTTTDITTHRIYTLMHDPVYRLGIAWQNVAYNQPPHTGFFLGNGMSSAPTPDIYLTP